MKNRPETIAKNKAEKDFILKREKDADIEFLVRLSDRIFGLNDTMFVLSGSYAIEAHTSNSVYHSDIDANIYTHNILIILPIIANILNLEFERELKLYKKTYNRLEYDLVPNLNRLSPKKLEFQFNKLDSKHNVPIVQASLFNSNKKEFQFKVKSLPYLIATWAIRISGQATNQKRQLKESDFKKFKQLVLCSYDRKHVIDLINKHPQMPSNLDANDIFNTSLKKLTSLKLNPMTVKMPYLRPKSIK